MLFQMMLSFDIAVIAIAILILIKVDPRYLKVYFLKVLAIYHDGNGDVLVGTVDTYFDFL